MGLAQEKQAGLAKRLGGLQTAGESRDQGESFSAPCLGHLRSAHPEMASTPQGIYTIPNRPTAMVPNVPYRDNFQTSSSRGDI